MRKFNLLFIGLIICSCSNAQSGWVKTMGGSENELGTSICVDNVGNVLSVGFSTGVVDFDPGPGTFTLVNPPTNTNYIYVSKLDASGNFVWAKALAAGHVYDLGQAIATDVSGNVYVAGSFGGTGDFDPGSGILNIASKGNVDIFLVKLNASGDLVWVKTFGAPTSSTPQLYSIAVDVSGSVFATGFFRGTLDFDPGAGVSNLTSNGAESAFILKLDNSGNHVWARKVGSIVASSGRSIALDLAGNILITGSFSDVADLDPGPAVSNLTAEGSSDIFILKLNANGSFVWAKGMGQTFNDFGTGITADGAGNVYTTGTYRGTVDFDPGLGVTNLTSLGNSDIFVQKLDNNGNFVLAKSLNCPLNSGYGSSIALDVANNIILIGNFKGNIDLDPGIGVDMRTSNGDNDFYIVKLNNNGNLIWGKTMGGIGSDVATSFVLNSTGDLYVTGQFRNTVAFDIATIPNTASGNADVFILKYFASALVGISENLKIEQNRFFPNPSIGLFSFIFSNPLNNVEFYLYNNSGQLVQTKKIDNQNFSIDLTGALSEVYTVRIMENNNIVLTQKLIKQ